MMSVERRREANRKWRAANLERDKARQRAYREKNKEKLKLARKAYYLANKERENTASREYKRKHIERCRDMNRAWRKANPEKFMAALRLRMARWESKNPGSRTARSAKRRAIAAGVTVNPSLVREFTLRVRKKKKVRCYYCDRLIPGESVHIDHVVAINGKERGSHEVGNLCASCPSCNLRKSNKPISSWEKSGQQILAL